ncbi:hypothetical protein O181_082046 [Austropuccinia psidii MF-1]|uniref:Uncharacterized protein n=1 Tax=Austropuccinia psidii MF-1 TaxID=1389203 RepID=A0A9Q3FRU6_9BASI|nr:hypothetical protein [Austropuccinia psidii MF-1]
MASIDGKENHDALTEEWRKNNPQPSKKSAKNSPNSQHHQFKREKAATNSEQGQNKGTSHKPLNARLQNHKYSTGCHGQCSPYGKNNDGITEEGGSQIKISEIISDIFDAIPEFYEVINYVKNHISDKNSSICKNIKTNDLSLSKTNETLMCFEKVSRTIKPSNNDVSFGNDINEQSAIIKELTDKYYKFNIADINETRIKESINIINTDSKKVLDDISNSFSEVKTYTIALKKCFDASQEEVSKLTMKLNQVTADNTRQTELWQELTHKEEV